MIVCLTLTEAENTPNERAEGAHAPPGLHAVCLSWEESTTIVNTSSFSIDVGSQRRHHQHRRCPTLRMHFSTNWTFPRRHRPLSSPTSRNTPAPISPSIHGFSPSQFVKTQFLSFSSRAAFPFFCRFALNVRIHSLLRSLPSAAVATHCWQATSQLAGHCFLLQTAAATEGATAAAATTKRAP